MSVQSCLAQQNTDVLCHVRKGVTDLSLRTVIVNAVRHYYEIQAEHTLQSRTVHGAELRNQVDDRELSKVLQFTTIYKLRSRVLIVGKKKI